MTISSTSSSVSYQTNGAATRFPFAFPVSADADLTVTVTDNTQSPPVATTLAPSEYGVSGIGDPTGGIVTLPLSGPPLPAGQTVTVRRIVAYVQNTTFANQATFYPEIVEHALDGLTEQTQQLAEELSRAVQVPVGSGIDPGGYLGLVQTAANGASAAATQSLTAATAATASENAAQASATAAATSAAGAAGAAASAATAAGTAQTYAAALSATSTSALAIGNGSRTFVTQAGKQFNPGQFITAADAVNPTVNWMTGQVTSYSGTTLVATIGTCGGSGTIANWQLSVSGATGPQGPLGPQGPQGIQGPSGSGSGDMLRSNNLSDLVSAGAARANLGLAAVAASGAYADLSGRPALAAAAISGAYADLTGKPTLGTAASQNTGTSGANIPLLNGANAWSGPQRASTTALADGATITPDFSANNDFSVTLGGNRTLANPTNLVAGQSGHIAVGQDATGSRTLAYGGYWKFGTAGVPTLSTAANAKDVIAYWVLDATHIVAACVKGVQ